MGVLIIIPSSEAIVKIAHEKGLLRTVSVLGNAPRGLSTASGLGNPPHLEAIPSIPSSTAKTPKLGWAFGEG